MSKYISIDLDAQGVFVASGTARSGGPRIERVLAWTGTEAAGGPPPLTNETAKRFGEELRDRLRAAGVANAPVVLAIGRDRVVLKELRYPAVPAHEEPNIVRFQAMKELSDSPDEVVLDYTPLENGAANGERRSMAVVVRKDLFSAIQKMCAAANLKLAAVTPRPYAIAAGIGHAIASGTTTAPESRSDAVAVMTLGPGGGEFTIVRNGDVIYTLAIPAPVIASETMLLAQVRRNLTTYAGSNPAHPVQALYVADADDSWGLRLRPALGIPVYSYDPLGEAAREIQDDLRGRFAGATGLLAARGGNLPINFATPRQPRAEADPKKSQILVAALVAIIVLAVGGLGGWFMLDSAEAKVARLTADRDQRKQTYDRLEPEKKRLDAAEQWKARRVVWLDELYEWATRTHGAEGLYAESFYAKDIQPNQKTGKQDHQATMSLKVGTRNPNQIRSLLADLDEDNPKPGPNPKTGPKTKYYDAINKKPFPAPSYDKQAQEVEITASVNARTPAAYTRAAPAGYKPPTRKGYPPQPAASKDAEDTEPGADDADEEGGAAKVPVAPTPKKKG